MYKAHNWQSIQVKNKFNIIFTVCFLFQTFNSFSQNLTQSPYSFFGVGDLQYMGSATLGNMGQVSQGFRRKYDLNILNPASYSALAQTNLEAGAMLNNGTLKSGSSTLNASLSGLAYFNFGTLISKKGIGVAFGAAPYSALGYDIRRTTLLKVDTLNALIDVNATTSQLGSGGLTRAFFGVGTKINKFLSAGINVGYIFGQINSRMIQTAPAQYYIFNWSADRKDNVNGFLIEYGFQSHFDSLNFSLPKYKTVIDSNGFEHKKLVRGNKNPVSVNAGLTFNAETNLTGNQRYSFRTLAIGGLDLGKDSIKTDETKTGSVTIPFEIKYGIAITNNTNWTVAADFGTAAWSNYSSFGQNKGLQNSWHFNVGACWLPDIKEDSRNYFKRLEYRLGYRMEQTNIFIDNQSVNISSYHCGIGIPIAERDRYKKFSRVNVGFEYLTRGANTTLINEQFYKLTIGLVFSDRWFIKYKYD
jgi:hypothetical protein